MDDSDKKAFGLSISAMLELFGQEATTPRLTGYWIGLRDLSLEQVKDAVAVAMATGRKAAFPAELREIVAGGSSEDRAIAAWGDVQKAVAVSYMADLDFEDRVINAVVRNLGGRVVFFHRLAGGSDSEKWLRIEFLKSYASLAAGSLSDEATAVLGGEATRGMECGKVFAPRLEVIGCDEKRAALLPPRKETRGITGPARDIPRVELRKA